MWGKVTGAQPLAPQPPSHTPASVLPSCRASVSLAHLPALTGRRHDFTLFLPAREPPVAPCFSRHQNPPVAFKPLHSPSLHPSSLLHSYLLQPAPHTCPHHPEPPPGFLSQPRRAPDSMGLMASEASRRQESGWRDLAWRGGLSALVLGVNPVGARRLDFQKRESCHIFCVPRPSTQLAMDR